MRYPMPDGFEATFEHRQFEMQAKVRLLNGHEITPRGFTYCALTQSGILLAEGVAWCRDTDQFTKSIGRHIALGRALKAWHTGTPSASNHQLRQIGA